jgi:crotonobetainyl-CoA:carnitine CoA-transferase CaiB-like acyl-CoA transferase
MITDDIFSGLKVVDLASFVAGPGAAVILSDFGADAIKVEPPKGLYRRERTGKGSYVTPSLLAEGVWSASVAIQAALCGAKFSPQHDRKNPANAGQNIYKSSDDIWFMLVVTPDKIPAVAEGIGRTDLLRDARFSDLAKLAANMDS